MKSNFITHTLFFFLALCLSQDLWAQPANDNCANARLIATDSACVTGASRLTGQTLTAATNQAYTLTSVCSYLSTARDVWYKFVAKTPNPSVMISNQGSGWGGIGNVMIQLFSGSCGSFTEKACGVGSTTVFVTPSLANPLPVGDTCYIRIHKNVAGAIAANHTFDICVTDPLEKGGRTNEIFAQTVLSGSGVLLYPWEITYGNDDSLWITEARGYKVYKMNSSNGGKRTVLDLTSTSTWLGAVGTGGADTLYAQQTLAQMAANPNGWPQGGFAGLAVHPQMGDNSGHDFVYVTYVHRYLSGTAPNGIYYRNKLVRFTYNNSTYRLESPVVLLNNLPGGQDHNSQRLIIAPVTKGGTPYLFMGAGDMGAGQFGNKFRPQNAQNPASYEGKILRLNLESDFPVTGQTDSTQWIPNDNPYQGGNSAVWSIGMRNNQGLAYDTATNTLYGSKHGPYSDDEINILEGFVNHGHPLVIGYSADGNYNGNAAYGTNTSVSAGAAYNDATAPSPALPAPFNVGPYNGKSTNPPIGNETTNVATINASGNGQYKDPLFCAYAVPSITATWQSPGGNANWMSEAWSGLDLYSNKIIPGWNRSLVAGGLKWGRLIRLKLNATGTATLPSNVTGSNANAGDTITYFQSANRYRDLAFSPNGKDMFLVMDNNSATSGPGVGNPTVAACPGCVVKYSFLGYGDAGGLSTIPKTVAVTDGAANTCNQGTTVTIDGSNNFLWVPITGPDGNIMAEINAMGQSLGVVTSSFYQNSGAIRVKGSLHYLDRNITITPTVTSFGTPVKVRLYMSKAEFDALAADPLSGVGSILQMKVIKNNDPCGSGIVSTTTTLLTPTNTILTDLQHGANGYVVQVNVTGFSSFYFGADNSALPLQLLTFTGTLKNNSTVLNWTTTNEYNTSHFIVERSKDAQQFDPIGTVQASGIASTESRYNFNDDDVAFQQSEVVYYRLKMYDKNGTYRYSNIVRVLLPGVQSEVTVAPNPVGSEVNASIIAAETGQVEWQIIDNAVRVLLRNNASLEKVRIH
ncbi:MAG: PQQ-dependent sugar dehydrogenase [Chitinophagaceae bacterium]|nr:PQQ-dependent sugar dehydrogenase [Chitinophagaceae bacterium]